jgi:hypothetical protein
MSFKVILKRILPILVLLVMGCHEPAQKEVILFDFETDSELDRLHWKCHSLLNLSDENVTHGKGSLKMELYPAAYPGLLPELENESWMDYEYLGFDIYNPEAKDMKITVRIDDREDAPDYSDRYNHSIILEPGLNRIKIQLNDLITSGTKRKLDLRSIHSLAIFMVNPSERTTLYVDYMRLQG